ncbi:MAG: chemotaxis protein CheD [Spirochaetaceae bacterium]
MHKKYHPKFKHEIITIYAGELYIGTKGEVISTVLGSCISVCLFDVINNVGGMNHFMLPEGNSTFSKEHLTDKPMRYGIKAMEILISEMQKKGALRKNLTGKIFGGGNIIIKQDTIQSIGYKNISFAREFLKMEGIPIESENVGNNYGRKLYFLTGENTVFVKEMAIDKAIEKEEEYIKSLSKYEKESKSDITLF